MLERVEELLNDLKTEIQQSLDNKGITASGKTRDGIRVVRYDSGVKLVSSGGAPIASTEIGRPAGKIPFGFVDIIKEWASFRGIPFKDEKEKTKFAGAVAFGKIKRFGYGRPSPSKFGSSDPTVYSDKVPAVVDEIKKEMRIFVKEMIKIN